MTCKPSDNILNPVVSPGIPIPGFGIPFSPVQLDLGSFDLPESMLQLLPDLLKKISVPFPGILKISPNLDNATKSIFDAISKAFNLIAPFLGFYNFIMAALNLIVCIIEVLCAIPNPFAVSSKLVKLFKECLPDFLALFPSFALIAMILAILLLILFVITYMIESILNIIDMIKKNLEVYSKAQRLNDAQSSLAAAQKIASLLCSIQNIMSLFIAIASIMSVVQSLMKIGSSAICSDDEGGCCSEEICPNFIKMNADGITVTKGKLVYYNQIGTDVAAELGVAANLFNLPPIRLERWQIFDLESNNQYTISDIITPIAGNIFWPEGIVFTKDSQIKKSVYTVDLNFTIDPKILGFSTDTKGSRKFVVKDCIVVRKPYIGVYDYENNLSPSFKDGTLNIEGGLVFEEDNSPFVIGGKQATLNDFIHKADSLGSLPSSDDSITIDDIEFTWKPNVPALASYNLTTVGCIPSIALEKGVRNAILTAEGMEPVIVKMGDLPDITKTVQTVQDGLDKLRKNVSLDTLDEFANVVKNSFDDLTSDTQDAICRAIRSGTSQFNSTMELDTDVQFATRKIYLTVVLHDAAGSVISTSIPEPCASSLAKLLSAKVTLGSASEFVYNGIDSFVSEISTMESGIGNVVVSFDEKQFNLIDKSGETTTILERVLSYEFIGVDEESPVRRDESDVVGS